MSLKRSVIEQNRFALSEKKRRRDLHDSQILNANARRLNDEAADVLEYANSRRRSERRSMRPRQEKHNGF
jgi:hypothetical protein